MYFSKVTPLKPNIFSENWWVRKMNISPQKLYISLFRRLLVNFFGGQGKFNNLPSPSQKNPIALEVDVCPAEIIQTAMGLWLGILSDRSLNVTSRRITRIRNTSRGFDEVWVDPGGYPTYQANSGYFRWRDWLFVREDVKFTNFGSTIRKKSEVIFSIQLSNCCGMHFITWNPLSHSENMASKENCVSFLRFFVFGWDENGVTFGLSVVLATFC